MRTRLLDFLTCPYDEDTPLTLRGFSEERSRGEADVLEGVLLCDSCRRWFPITDGVPALFRDELRQGDGDFVARRRDAMADVTGSHPHPAPRQEVPGEPPVPADASDVLRMTSERRARDRQARQYDRILGLKILRRIEAAAYRDALRGAPSGPILEAGCGTGRLTDVFAALTDELICADFSLVSIKRNQVRHAATGGGIHYLQCDLTHLPLRASCVGAIAHAGVYEHIPSRTARGRWLRHAERVLKPGGRFVVSAYRYAGLMRLFPKEGEHAGGIPFVRFTEREFRDEVGAVFDIRQIRPSLGIYLVMGVCDRRSATHGQAWGGQ